MIALIRYCFIGVIILSCGDAADDATGTLDAVPAGSHRIFVTSETLKGNFASEGDAFTIAHAKCEELRRAANFTLTYKAIISTNIKAASSEISITSDVYGVDSSGSSFLVAASTDFWSTSTSNLLGRIQYDEKNQLRTSVVWTGTSESGGITSSSCTNWTVSTGSGQVGSTDNFGTEWIDDGFQDCSNAYPIYCISQ